MHLSAIFENIPIGTISWNSWKLIRFLLKQDVQCLRPDYSLFPYDLFLGLKHSPIKIFKLKFIFGIWSCSVGHKILFSIGLNDCLSGFICPRRLLQVINLYIYLGTAGNRTVNTMPNIQHLITTWQFEDHVTPKLCHVMIMSDVSNRPNRTWFVLLRNQMTIITQFKSLHNFQGILTSSNQLPPD